MTIINTLNINAITFIPLNTNFETLYGTFKNENTQELYTLLSFAIIQVKDIFYIVFENLSFLEEGTFYNITIHNGDIVNGTVYKDRIFCTDQDLDIQNYSINEGQYTLPTIDNNDYITI